MLAFLQSSVIRKLYYFFVICAKKINMAALPLYGARCEYILCMYSVL